MEMVLVRHAETDAAGRRLTGRSPGVPLNEAGRRQALELAARCAHVSVAAVYSSPLERSRETAEAVAIRHGLPVTTLTALQELDYGAWQGCWLEALDDDPHWRAYNRRRSLHRIPGGESLASAQARMVECVEMLQAEHSSACRVLLVTHADVIRATLTLLLGMPLDFALRLAVPPASVTVVRLQSDTPLLVSMNDSGPLHYLAS